MGKTKSRAGYAGLSYLQPGSMVKREDMVPGKPFSSGRPDERDESDSLDIVLPDGEVMQALPT
jgi:hypothetical protein